MGESTKELQFETLKLNIKYLTKNISRQAEEIKYVPLVPGVNRTQHLGYVSCIAVLCPTATGLLLESTNKASIVLYVILIVHAKHKTINHLLPHSICQLAIIHTM